jgi:hypothetical protein
VSARVIHAGLVLGILFFLAIAWWVGHRYSLPSAVLPERRVLYVVLFFVTGVLFGGAVFAANRLPPHAPGEPSERWWERSLPSVVLVWALVEGPTLLGIAAYLLTRDFRVLIATAAGLLLFGHYSPSRLQDRP